ncbi:MAG TPA: hypothetical protein VH277_16200 [Gemmatimonadaceae bacterium]|jgi:hypothetical protein|nr:hypothetical protein [Gemmatimonadaceae bacterium]
MSEVLIEVEAVVIGPDNKLWVPRVCGAPCAEVVPEPSWQGWLEFTPIDTVALPVRTAPAMEGPTRDAVLDWARGLTYAYLGDTLCRALASGRGCLPP